jgi:hypothetical protein
MVERVTGGKALPPEVVQHIVAKTDGVPLFVEELTKTVVVEEHPATVSPPDCANASERPAEPTVKRI